ncbi:phosphotransferase family enzyme [Streptomyces puniciscabiei]|uniref:Phosphotransferase family enzyme n=1 Tax=Streptomyces puniciscabiei TaxID=164348 RepID=A0A542THT3_9ACTN|nr:aminoglycoside phosphotransferase family protein [Streptomyces puniciscabiei]TQK86277.1 phosphotransferase family enzyme [Streptomyces puniciscabiei]
MINRDEAAGIRPLTQAWVRRHLEVGERILGTEALHGGITAEMRRLTIGTRDGGTRDLVLRTYVHPFYVQRAQDWLNREAGALTVLAATDVPAPGLVAVDPTAAQCEYPSLLMTHLAGRAVLGDEGLETRVPLLARQLVAIHALRPAERPPEYVALTTADTVVVPKGADAATWAAAIDVIRRPAPPCEGRFLHRDFQPGNVLFAVPPSGSAAARITGVIDWAATSWGPADLDVAHCSTHLALLHGPAWGQHFTEAYEEAGGVLAAAASERLYWPVRDALACSEEVRAVAQAWREAGRTELTARAVEERLDAYVTALVDPLG